MFEQIFFILIEIFDDGPKAKVTILLKTASTCEFQFSVGSVTNI